MSQRYGYPHASSSDYFIDNPQVVRQLDASLAHSQPTNGSTPVDKEAPGGNGTNADDVRSERVLDYADNGPRASGSAYFIDRPSGGSPIAIVPADDSVFDGTTMITEIQEPLIACDSLAGMNANPAANPGSVPTALDGSEQSTNVIKVGSCADSVLQPAKSVALDNNGAETCSPVPIVENPSATTVEVPESGVRSGIAHSGSNQASTAPEDKGNHVLVTVRNAPVTPLTPSISAKMDIAEVATARESSSADSVRTALEASDAVNTARETRSAADMRTAIEPSGKALLTALEKSDTVGTARSSASDESLLTAIETQADVTTAQEPSEGFITTCENAPISKMMTAVEAIPTALEKSEVVSTAREAVIDAQAEVSTAQGRSDARGTGSTTCLETSEEVQTAHERSDQVSPSTAHEATTAIEADSGPSEVRTAVEKSEELAKVIETSEATHTALDKSDDVITAREAVIDAQTEATSLDRSDARATGSTICRLANIKTSKEVQTAHERSDQVTTAHQVTTVIETDSEPSEVHTAVEKSKEFGEKPVSTDEVLTARQGTEDVTTARDSTSSRNLQTAIEAPNAQLTAVEQTGAPSSSSTSVPATSQPSFLVNISATSSSILTVVLMLCQILRTFIELVVSPPANLPADRRPMEAQVLTATEMPDELTARSDSCASLHTSIVYKHEDAYADTEVDRTSSATRGLNAECARADERSGSVKQLNPSDEELHTAATIIRELALDAEVHTAVETPSVHDAIDLRALAEDTPDLKTCANV